MRIPSALILSLSLPALLAAGDNWPSFRGPTGDGVSTANNIPTTWSESENVLWKAPIHDKGWSSPVVWGNQIWLTTAKVDGKAFYAIALDKRSGKIVHDLKLFTAENPPNTSQYNSFASPTPAIEDGRVYVHFGSFGTACLNTATGKEIWRRTDLPCDHYRNPASSPVIHGDSLFLNFDGYDLQYTVALDKKTGDTIWRKDHALPYPDNGDLKKAYATPAIFELGGKLQVVASAATGTIGYDAKTGDEIWRVVHGGMNEACRPILAHGLIYLTTGHTMNLIAVKAGRTGDLTKDGIAWRADKVGPTRPSPLVLGDLLFMVNDTGILFCLDAKTGTKHWQERLDGKFSASPILLEGNIVAIAENGKMFVRKANSSDAAENLIASNRLDLGPATASDGQKIDPRYMASPAAVDGMLLIRSHTHLYAIGKK